MSNTPNTSKKWLKFYRNWFELAEFQTDDKKRLAFYDAVMRYAFRGEEPAKVENTAKGADKAAYFAYLTVAPIIGANDSDDADRPADNERFRKAAQARWKADATHNATHDATHDALHDAKCNASLIKEEEKNRRIRKEEAATRAHAHARPTQQQFAEGCITAGVPEDFARELWTELEQAGWCDGAGEEIANWRRYAKTTYLERCRAAKAAGAADGIGFHRISEGDL